MGYPTLDLLYGIEVICSNVSSIEYQKTSIEKKGENNEEKTEPYRFTENEK